MGSGWGGQVGCERRIEVFVNERRSKVFVKIQKKKMGGGVLVGRSG